MAVYSCEAWRWRLAAMTLALVCGGELQAQERAGRPAAAAGGATPARDRSGYRKLAPGVEVTIPPDKQEEDTFSPHDVIEILQGVPNLDWKPKFSPATQTLKQLATGVTFRRQIWYLEFTFKPVRMVWVDEPQPSGKMQRKPIWYMVYHVKNNGGHLGFQKQEDGSYTPQEESYDVRFFPLFVLEAHEYKKAYLDRLIPVAIDPIQKKEDPNRKLLNSMEIGGRPIPLSTDREDNSVWGVATWEDVDPKIDFFSISVQGLTNAYKWTDPPGAFQPGSAPGTGRILAQKTLVLNFWRPGDESLDSDKTVHFGIPGKVDYQWVYR